MTFRGTLTETRAERRRLLAAGRPEPPAEARDGGSLDEFTRRYLQAASARQAASTIRTTNDAYRLRVSPTLGDLQLEELTRERLEVWVAGLVQSGSSRDAVHKAVKALRVILSAAVEWGRLRENPARRVKLPNAAPGEGRAAAHVLTEEQLSQLLTAGATSLRIETMLRAAAEVGLRRGEVIGLRWTDLDLPARRLTVERAVWQERSRHGKPRRVVKAPKGGRPRRVAISETFARRLGDWYALSVVEAGADATGYIWPGRVGQPMGEGTPRQALERALQRAGLMERDGPTPVTFHGLRHTCASIMLARGVPLTIVARQLGHANPNITATIYAHLLEEAHLDRAAAVFDTPEATATPEETPESITAPS